MWKPLLPDQEDQAAEVPEPKPLGIGMDHEPDCDSVGPCGSSYRLLSLTKYGLPWEG